MELISIEIIQLTPGSKNNIYILYYSLLGKGISKDQVSRDTAKSMLPYFGKTRRILRGFNYNDGTRTTILMNF